MLLRRTSPLWNHPFRELDRLRNEVDRLFSAYHLARRRPFGVGDFPPVNIYEDRDNIYVVAELPGMDPDDIDIVVHGDRVVLKGSRKGEHEEQGGSVHRRERRSGSFHRELTLPERVDSGKATAEYTNGVLKLVLPKFVGTSVTQVRVQSE